MKHIYFVLLFFTSLSYSQNYINNDNFDPNEYIEDFYVSDFEIIPYQKIDTKDPLYQEIIDYVKENEATIKAPKIVNIQPIKVMNPKALYYFLKDGQKELKIIDAYGEDISLYGFKEVLKNKIIKFQESKTLFKFNLYKDKGIITFYKNQDFFRVIINYDGNGYVFNTLDENGNSQSPRID